MECNNYTKKCPECQQEINYKTYRILQKSIKDNRVCRKCSNCRQNAYSEEEIQFILDNSKKLTMEECANKLGRSIYSLIIKVKKIKISFCKVTKDEHIQTCSKCRTDLTLDNFYSSKNRYKKVHSYCKSCSKILRDSLKNNKKEYDKEYRKYKYKTDINYKIRRVLRKRFGETVKKEYRKGKIVDLLGCSVEEFKKYLETKFKEGMSWNNYGLRGWHIDHIIPCSKFDLIKEEEQKKCFHFSNLQPLWWNENLSKGNRLLEPDIRTST